MVEELDFFVDKYLERLKESSHLAPNGQCQIWAKATTKTKVKYGAIFVKFGCKSFTTTAHRLSYVVHNRITFDDIKHLDVSHLCHNSLCVNPIHLTLEPHPVNNNRIHCVSLGHCLGHDRYPQCLLNLRL